jgi:hypothetical protein
MGGGSGGRARCTLKGLSEHGHAAWGDVRAGAAAWFGSGVGLLSGGWEYKHDATPSATNRCSHPDMRAFKNTIDSLRCAMDSGVVPDGSRQGSSGFHGKRKGKRVAREGMVLYMLLAAAICLVDSCREVPVVLRSSASRCPATCPHLNIHRPVLLRLASQPPQILQPDVRGGASLHSATLKAESHEPSDAVVAGCVVSSPRVVLL